MSLRLLFASTHCLLDPTSGAAICTRDAWHLLAEGGHDCRAVTAGVLDSPHPGGIPGLIEAAGLNYRAAKVRLEDRSVRVLDLTWDGVRATVLPIEPPDAGPSPNRTESEAYLSLVDQAVERFRPQALLTYGGHPANLEMIRRVRQRGIPVGFFLHNFAYADPRLAARVDRLFTPSHYAARFYATRLGVRPRVLSNPIRPEGVLVTPEERRPEYLTAVNPQPAKGLRVVARIVELLAARRPEIPVLIVEGRGTAEALGRCGLDLSGLSTLHRMAVTPEPRDFYRVSRAVVMPSLWRESQGRVAMEAMLNGIPVLASDRGALPETLGNAGFCLHIPRRHTDRGETLPTPQEVAPWLAVVERLWDDPEFADRHGMLGRTEARRWAPEVVTEQWEREMIELAGEPLTPDSDAV